MHSGTELLTWKPSARRDMARAGLPSLFSLFLYRVAHTIWRTAVCPVFSFGVSFRVCFLLFFLVFSSGVTGQGITHWEALVRAENQWSYLAATSEPPVDWTSPEFNDTSWKKGPGGIGYGDNDDATVVSGVNTLYMRHTFQVADPSAILAVLLYMDYDDGFVAYLNGTEIARANMGSTYRPSWNSFAVNCDAEAQRPSGGTPPRFSLRSQHLSSFRNGANVLAIQVHNCNATSSDLSSTAFLVAGLTGLPGQYQPLPNWMTSPANENSHLPLVVIDTYGMTIPNEPKITVDMKIIDNGPGRTNTLFDPGNVFTGSAAIEIRGQSSQMFPKKSYGFELRNTLGDEVTAPLLGMPAEADWILYAPYSDKTLLRNALTFHLGGHMGRYQPRFRFCELYINGDYKGIYQLTEKIKRDPNRVDIAKLNPDELVGDDVTGGYIVKVDKTQDLLYSEFFISYPDITFPNSRAYSWTWDYPKAGEIAQAQKAYFQSFIKTAENALNGSNFNSAHSGYPKYLDVPSFIDFQIVNELANNVDGYRYSTFFHKDKDSNGGKLVAGPLWDFDLCYGNVDYAPERLATNYWLYTNYGPREDHCMHWWYRLMQDPAYRDALKLRYSILRRGILHSDSIMEFIDSQTGYLGAAVDRNFKRWPVLTQYVWPNSGVRNTYSAEVFFLKDWISRRLDWMDTQWLVPVAAPGLTAHSGVQVWPNPFRGELHLTLPAGASRVTMELFDMRGVKVASHSFFSQNTHTDHAGHNTSGIAPSTTATGPSTAGTGHSTSGTGLSTTGTGLSTTAATGHSTTGTGLSTTLSGLTNGIYLLRISGNGFIPYTTKIVKE